MWEGPGSEHCQLLCSPVLDQQQLDWNGTGSHPVHDVYAYDRCHYNTPVLMGNQIIRRRGFLIGLSGVNNSYWCLC